MDKKVKFWNQIVSNKRLIKEKQGRSGPNYKKLLKIGANLQSFEV
jgi:hypothetical protein